MLNRRLRQNTIRPVIFEALEMRQLLSGTISEIGEKVVPVLTEDITEEGIKKFLNDHAGTPAAAAADDIKEGAKVALKEFQDSVKVKDPALYNLIAKKWNEMVDNMVKDANAKMGDVVTTFKTKLAKAEEGLADKVKKLVDTLSPKVQITGDYRYQPNERNNGSPGWDNIKVKPLPGEIKGVTPSVEFDLDLELNAGVAAGVEATIKIPVKFHIELEADVDFVADEVHLAHTDKPELTVDVEAGVDLNVKWKVSGGADMIFAGIGNATKVEIPFKKFTATLDADPKTAR